jgi:hypothetical protein
MLGVEAVDSILLHGGEKSSNFAVRRILTKCLAELTLDNPDFVNGRPNGMETLVSWVADANVVHSRAETAQGIGSLAVKSPTKSCLRILFEYMH